MQFEIPETLANALLEMIDEDSPLARRLREYSLSRGKSVVPSYLLTLPRLMLSTAYVVRPTSVS